MTTVGDLMGLTDEERGWLERRKDGSLTPRQFMLVTELQTRGYLYTHMNAGPDRDAWEAKSIALRDEVRAVDFETSGMDYLNGLNRRLVELHREIVAACGQGRN